MLARTAINFLRPRHIMFTPPPLAKRTGLFRCKMCKDEWKSESVWVTKMTQRVYQGESCESCGTTNKPYYVGRSAETMFNRAHTPHAVKPGASSSRHGKKLKHQRFNWHVQRGRH